MRWQVAVAVADNGGHRIVDIGNPLARRRRVGEGSGLRNARVESVSRHVVGRVPVNFAKVFKHKRQNRRVRPVNDLLGQRHIAAIRALSDRVGSNLKLTGLQGGEFSGLNSNAGVRRNVRALKDLARCRHSLHADGIDDGTVADEIVIDWLDNLLRQHTVIVSGGDVRRGRTNLVVQLGELRTALKGSSNPLLRGRHSELALCSRVNGEGRLRRSSLNDLRGGVLRHSVLTFGLCFDCVGCGIRLRGCDLFNAGTAESGLIDNGQLLPVGSLHDHCFPLHVVVKGFNADAYAVKRAHLQQFKQVVTGAGRGDLR